MPSDDYTNPHDPEGCRAVIPLSDGIRIILADGTVAHLQVTTDDGDELTEITGHPSGGGVFGGIDHDTRVEIGIISDHEAAQHPMVQEALEDLGFWGEVEDDKDELLGYVYYSPAEEDDRSRMVCVDCEPSTELPEDMERANVRDNGSYGDVVPYQECAECGEVMRPDPDPLEVNDDD
ncbi:hypothetical protein HALLA_12030 [Halostagnicola larsenii XH-48]|uniref:Uncharacterized protein n=1 Tax=Halostagnicola larsenii XH-48 TaxID=797299 RepID=W0JV85_9EURY|nr:hypothetical protein [Halostagnicola larsenii]AHG00906.1 hypothetical protein HALLA_11740 [Halostagnicola larsenii XH-48]AHG00953.1 hypothetical protein HALLA_12030 [Halostagnicola larsenii XH-48]